MNENEPIGLGLVGCGAFGQFCMEAFGELPNVRVLAVADTIEEAARAVSERFGVPGFTDIPSLLSVHDISVVHVATPPSTHHDIVVQAVEAGKHVLCEKPLATEPADAVGMIHAAADAGVIVPVNFVLRHNAVTDRVKAVLDCDALGEVLAAWLVNCAADSNLPAGHWFWNRKISGGIFIEHGVHFFDLYRHWLGPGELVDARTHTRPGTNQQDRVECVVRHGEAVVHHYHGFDQVGPMDRTEHRILCELGDIRVSGWIPLTMDIDAAVDDAGLEALQAACPDAKIECDEAIGTDQREVSGRGKPRRLTRRIRLTCTPDPDKQAVYRRSVQALFADQLAAIGDPDHPRRVLDTDGLKAVEMAAAARDMAALTNRKHRQ
jgi:predicted dehydrogenase